MEKKEQKIEFNKNLCKHFDSKCSNSREVEIKNQSGFAKLKDDTLCSNNELEKDESLTD